MSSSSTLCEYLVLLLMTLTGKWLREGELGAFGGLPEEDGRFRELGSSTSRLLVDDAGFERYPGQPRMSAVPVVIEPLR